MKRSSAVSSARQVRQRNQKLQHHERRDERTAFAAGPCRSVGPGEAPSRRTPSLQHRRQAPRCQKMLGAVAEGAVREAVPSRNATPSCPEYTMSIRSGPEITSGLRAPRLS